MSPQNKNIENKGLPKRWRFRKGFFWYRVPPGQEHRWDGKKEFPLGKTEAAAYREFAQRIQVTANITTMDNLCDRYELEVLPTKAPATQKSNRYSLKRIRTAFGRNPIGAIRPCHIYSYRDTVGNKESRKKANLDLEVLSHMFTKSIEWGCRDDHPMTDKKVVKFSLQGRDRYVEDWELDEFRKTAGVFLNAYCNLKGLLGLDKADMLSLKRTDIGSDRLCVDKRRKTRNTKKNPRKRYYPYFDESGNSTGVKEAIDTILTLKRPVGSIWLFCTRKGQPYIKEDGTTSGFDSIWQRRMQKALEETNLVERFTEHDLRAKAGSDLDTDEEAQRLLDHSNPEMTRRSYRRKGVKIIPGKGFITQD